MIWIFKLQTNFHVYMQMTLPNMYQTFPLLLEYIINADLHLLSTWFRQNYLEINASKTVHRFRCLLSRALHVLSAQLVQP